MGESDPLVEQSGYLLPQTWLGGLDMVVRTERLEPLVVIRGEPGTGKDVLARLIHAASARRQQSFVKVNCGLRPVDRLAMRVFGHERDARAGFTRAKLGAVEFADHGTLMLDDLGSLPQSLQADILPLLQAREARRVGGRISRHFDVQLIVTTREPLTADQECTAWRPSDHLRIVDFHLPPLRERRGDIATLAAFFLERFNAHYGRTVRLASEDVALLTTYSWPGNVRELETLMRHVALRDDAWHICQAIESRRDEINTSASRQPA